MRTKRIISRISAIAIAMICNCGPIYSEAYVLSNSSNYKITYKVSKTLEFKTDKKSLDFVSAREGNKETDLSDNSSNNTSDSVNTVDAYKQIDLSNEKEMMYLANTVMHEIGSANDDFTSDPFNCPIQNVVCVILNRVVSNSSDFKNMNSIEDVVKAPNQFTGITPFLERKNYANENVYKAIKAVVEEHGDITDGALYFHSGARKGFFASNSIQFMFKDKAGHSFYKNK